jgi:hypothetical protein
VPDKPLHHSRASIDIPPVPAAVIPASREADLSGSAAPPADINDLLKEHTSAAADWRHSDVAKRLHDWAELFNVEFDLCIDTPAIRLTGIRRAYGTYLFGRNSFGLRHEITLNTRYRGRSPDAWLRTLLHELLHEWQALHGTPSRSGAYHNREFRDKAASFGLLVDAAGRSAGVVDGPFTKVLARAGITAASEEKSPVRRLGPELDVRAAAASPTKMQKWSCGCTNVRAAVVLQATCNACGNRFRRAQSSW